VRTLDLEQERGLGEILTTCLSLYASYFLLFATLAFGVVLPVDLALYGVGAGQLWSGYDDSPPLAVSIAALPVATLVVLPLVSANHARAVVALGEGTVPAIGRTLLEGVRLLPAVALVVLLYDLGSFAGLLLLIVPGVYLYVRWYVCAQAAVVEGLRGRRALRRSGDLIKGSWWRVFGISIVIGLIVAAAEAGISMPLDVLADRADSGLVSLAGEVLAEAIIYSFGALSATLLYFDLRSRCDRREPEQ
jgi:hypothetical protein